MKIWHQYGTEHSSNLVMIGRFKDATEATKVKEIIDALSEQVRDDEKTGTLKIGDHSGKYGNEILDLLGRLNVNLIGPEELEQFAFEFKVKVLGEKVVLTTEEYDISAFLKVLIINGARIEIYSAHDYTETEYGRGK
jgi:hypothetical protein